MLLALPSERRGHARAPDTVSIVINGEYNMMRTIFFSTLCTLMWGGKIVSSSFISKQECAPGAALHTGTGIASARHAGHRDASMMTEGRTFCYNRDTHRDPDPVL